MIPDIKERPVKDKVSRLKIYSRPETRFLYPYCPESHGGLQETVTLLLLHLLVSSNAVQFNPSVSQSSKNRGKDRNIPVDFLVDKN